jgi:hypothetical protein
MSKIARVKSAAPQYVYTEGIGTGGYGFDHSGSCWDAGTYLPHVKHWEGRYHKSEGGGSFTGFVRWTKEIVGDYKYFYETPTGEVFDDVDVEWVDDPNGPDAGVEASVTVSDGS